MPSKRRSATANPNAKKFTLTPREVRDLPPMVMGILRQHVGADDAIVGAQIARQCGYGDDRKIREAIRLLRLAHHPIAMSNGRNLGYFMARTRAEFSGFLANMGSRLSKESEVLRAGEATMDEIWGIPCQPELFERIAGTSKELEHASAR